MPSALEVTKKQLYSDAHNRYEQELIPIEDCRFKNFTDFLDEIDVFKNPIASRANGRFKQGMWSIMGYSTNTYRQEIEDDIELEDGEGKTSSGNNYDVKWEYTIFNGVFTDDIPVIRATKQEIEKAINETERFLEKTFSNDLINDINEARDLQDQLIKQYNRENLERIDICIITDKQLGDQDKLPNRTKIKSADIECRIYYWDIRRWDAMKRSKSKREPINIDFNSSDYEIYKVPYLSKKTGKALDYYLAIFPGDLIADLYDLYNTRLLESNVRVFLTARVKANKGIRDTIGAEDGINAYKFFSYNNGISATAESIEVINGNISKVQDFQIVNGGQTTATIHYCRKRNLSLSDVFVAVKITALNKDENYFEVVKKISKAANTQSAVSNSDFLASAPQLISLEQIALKTPAQNQLDRNVYYYFERMKGQYEVIKSSQGTKRQQEIWSESYPKKLSFKKIELARWSNMMHGLPYHAAEGGEKQFETFMDEKYFKTVDFHIGSFKSLIGFGLLFKRIHKLCGTASGQMHLYPSKIIDKQTGQHAPVAMSTAIYTASYIHMITEGRIDYWSFFEFKHNLSTSIINSKIGSGANSQRVNSALDEILETFIDVIWENISTYGGAAAQEKSKKEECWNFVKTNAKVPSITLEELNTYLISKKELSKRETLQTNDDDLNYFNALNVLLENNGHIISSLFEISNVNSGYLAHKSTISNLIKKINQENKVLTANRIEEVFSFYEDLSNEGFEFKESFQTVFEHEIDVNSIYSEVFKDQKSFIERLYDYICEDEESFNENEKLYKEVKNIIENFYITYGLSIQDLLKLENVIKLIKN